MLSINIVNPHFHHKTLKQNKKGIDFLSTPSTLGIDNIRLYLQFEK